MSALPGRPSGNSGFAGMATGMNQLQMRPATWIGSPRKNANCWLRDATCQATSSATSTVNCQKRALLSLGRMLISCRLPELLRVAFQYFVTQHVPYLRVQFDKARVRANLGHVARTCEVDGELTDRMGRRAGGQDHDP